MRWVGGWTGPSQPDDYQYSMDTSIHSCNICLVSAGGVVAGVKSLLTDPLNPQSPHHPAIAATRSPGHPATPPVLLVSYLDSWLHPLHWRRWRWGRRKRQRKRETTPIICHWKVTASDTSVSMFPIGVNQSQPGLNQIGPVLISATWIWPQLLM